MGASSSKAAATKEATASVPPQEQLVADMQAKSLVQDKAWRLRTYHQVLVGSEAVDWMMSQPW